MTTNLETFFNESKNSHAREAILMHRFIFDLQLAAARYGYYINCYYDDVDHDGFDLIFDDQDSLMKIQVKSVCVNSKTKSWGIHKNILRPHRYMSNKFGFPYSPIGDGTQGGVVLIEYSDTSDLLDIKYHYTDLFMLTGFKHVFRRKHQRMNTINNLFNELHEGSGTEKISVPKTVFFEAKDPNALLSFMGFHGLNDNSWRYHILSIANKETNMTNKDMALYERLNVVANFIKEELANLTNDSFSIIENKECPNNKK